MSKESTPEKYTIKTLDDLYEIFNTVPETQERYYIYTTHNRWLLQTALSLWHLVFSDDVFKSGDDLSPIYLLSKMKVRPRIKISSEIIRNTDRYIGARDQYLLSHDLKVTLIAIYSHIAIVEVHPTF